MIAVDTNIIIRFLTRDDEKQYKKAFSIFNTQEVFISDTVILETEWVLRYAYEFSPEEICNALVKLFGLRNIYL
ncbi:MAG TPA: type II toxin-antitoxin system VapC family toxin, partial [Gammaproteobacteria bacterium]|nr:type II toxin-antitoxin system VapC family toxin [Gammaproteobacteria bacterium]